MTCALVIHKFVSMCAPGSKAWCRGRVTMGHLSCQGFVEVAKRAVFEIQKSSHLQPLAATRVAASGRKWPLGQVAASGRKWPQVAAWTANTSPNGPTLKSLKKNINNCFSRELHFFQFFLETWGESWNERKEITNRREELKRKDGRNELKGWS